MLLYKRIEIPNWQKIKEDFAYLANLKEGKEWIHLLDESEIANLSRLLTLEPNQKIKSVLAFSQDANVVQKIHVDGYSIHRTDASNVALNIPIQSVGKMIWYHGKYSLSESHNLRIRPGHDPAPSNTIETGSRVKYLKLDWSGNPEELDTVIIDQPTKVRVDVPHCVINQDDQRRIILSVRCSPDIAIG